MKTKKLIAAAFAMLFALSLAMASNGVLAVDGDKIHVNAKEGGYNYPAKYLYDVNFPYGQTATLDDPTLSEVIQFLSTGRQEGFPARVDIDSFINSELGKRTAELWYPYMVWYTDPMAPGLLDYWLSQGLVKEAYEASEGESPAYFVYSPVGAKEGGEKLPLIILNHGGGERAYQTEVFGFCQIAAEEGIILAASEDFSPAGNEKMLSAVLRDYPVDTTRIYIVGSSGGGNNAENFAVSHAETVAACAVMDQPVSLATRWWKPEAGDLETIKEIGLPLVYVGGTADMYGLYGIHEREFFATSEGAEPQFITGWNTLMDVFGISGKELTLEKRYELADSPDATPCEYYTGYPFDNVADADTTGTSPVYICTMDATDDLELVLTVNRAHMPSGHDAEHVWAFLSRYARDPETKKSVRID